MIPVEHLDCLKLKKLEYHLKIELLAKRCHPLCFFGDCMWCCVAVVMTDEAGTHAEERPHEFVSYRDLPLYSLKPLG